MQEELDIISQAILNEVVEFLEALFDKMKKDEGDDIKLAFDATPPSPDIYNWEKVHLEQFTEQYNIYKDEWWADQSFAPF